jgi:hypothetical protein
MCVQSHRKFRIATPENDISKLGRPERKDEDMDQPVRILGIPGSLRKGSYNGSLLRAAQQLAPANVQIEIFELHDIPAFNQDQEQNPPERVLALKSKVRAADAILFVTPEYNYSVPGVLKNAIDWASRPYGDSAWNDKPVAVMGASVGSFRDCARAISSSPDVRISQHACAHPTGGYGRQCGAAFRSEWQLEG